MCGAALAKRTLVGKDNAIAVTGVCVRRQRHISVCGQAHTSDSVVHKIGVSAAAAAGRRTS